MVGRGYNVFDGWETRKYLMVQGREENNPLDIYNNWDCQSNN
jgi:hypothetical protein